MPAILLHTCRCPGKLEYHGRRIRNRHLSPQAFHVLNWFHMLALIGNSIRVREYLEEWTCSTGQTLSPCSYILLRQEARNEVSQHTDWSPDSKDEGTFGEYLWMIYKKAAYHVPIARNTRVWKPPTLPWMLCGEARCYWGWVYQLVEIAGGLWSVSIILLAACLQTCTACRLILLGQTHGLYVHSLCLRLHGEELLT